MLALALVALTQVSRNDPQELSAWRAKQEASLKAPTGWLHVTGLHWLREGENRLDELPGLVFTLRDGKTGVVDNGRERELKPDVPGPADEIKQGTRTMFVIARGDRFAIRVRDTNSPFLRDFTGLKWYTPKPSLRITARWKPYPKPVKRAIATIVGIDEQMEAPGVAEFSIGGRAVSLEPVSASNGRLFFIFKDTTAGKTTYPAGRFLYADAPVGSTVILDFNRAYNPPCAFTPYATCPLPLPANRLPIAIPAGERNSGSH